MLIIQDFPHSLTNLLSGILSPRSATDSRQLHQAKDWDK